MSHTQLPDYGAVLAEVREVRRAGIVRLRELGIPVLTGLSAGPGEGEPGGPHFPAVERLLRTAVASMGGGTLQEAAEYSLGLARGTRDWPPADRRRRAAQVYGVSVERFRKHHELMVLGQVAEQIVRRAGDTDPSEQPAEGRAPHGSDAASDAGSAGRQLPAGHHRIPVRIGGRDHGITLHVHAVDLLRDIDVVVSPSNTHFALPEPYKASVAASLRRTAALRDPAGRIVGEPVRDELRAWTDRYAPQGLPVAPGTVAVTGAGALERQGVRYIHHAAVAVPRPGTNDYDVQSVDVTRAVTRVFALLGEARAEAEAEALAGTGTASGSVPGTASGAVPGSVPGAASGSVPGTASGAVPGSVPGAASGSVPGAASGSVPGTASAFGTGSVPGTASGSVPGTASGSAPGTASGTASGTVPGTGIGSGPGAGPGGATGAGAVSGVGCGPDSGCAADAAIPARPARPAPPTSVCLPLLGAGRGGLSAAGSLAAVWAAVEAELARGADWDVHLVVRSPERARLVRELLGSPTVDTAAVDDPTRGARSR
ncbi:hypothetical protein [Streptomyces sp. NPDC058623]|uniref:hypothetical protein n=1 Tax=Streptomyces sp. NPDC058623 TaxID=3346563 RepID=UPI00365445CC